MHCGRRSHCSLQTTTIFLFYLGVIPWIIIGTQTPVTVVYMEFVNYNGLNNSLHTVVEDTSLYKIHLCNLAADTLNPKCIPVAFWTCTEMLKKLCWSEAGPKHMSGDNVLFRGRLEHRPTRPALRWGVRRRWQWGMFWNHNCTTKYVPRIPSRELSHLFSVSCEIAKQADKKKKK